ncbi:MAG: hypothetical protein JKY51_11835 [Opitutaceae bacterium]|nr:hypothetical protein [Opitutaceae bacterium]
MRLSRVLTIGGHKKQLIDERIMLSLSSPGRAMFTVVVDAKAVLVNQLVTFDVGYTRQPALQRFFIGFVEKIVPQEGGRLKLFCRELAAALAFDVPLDCRHVTAADVLKKVTEVTGNGLDFVLPDEVYSKTKVASFFNIGSGYLLLEKVGTVFGIDDFIWQQQAGKVFAGSWAHSRWAAIPDLIIPLSMFDKQLSNESARIAALPKLRPGIRINGNRITSIDFSKNHMVLSWKK